MNSTVRTFTMSLNWRGFTLAVAFFLDHFLLSLPLDVNFFLLGRITFLYSTEGQINQESILSTGPLAHPFACTARTAVWNKQESRRKYWATRSSVCLFACTARTAVWNKQESRRKYWATRSYVRSHCSLVSLLRTARFARALRCAHWLARSLTSLFPLLAGK